MPAADAVSPENQILSGGMKTSEAAPVDTGPLEALAATDRGGGYNSTIFVLAAAGAALFALIASGSGEPLLLTLLAVLAMLGLFFLLAIAAGHVRIGDRAPTAEIIKAAADAADANMITRADGAALYWNAAFDAVFGRADAGPLAALEATCRADPDAAQALFRLMRAAERGEPRCEDVRIRVAAGVGAERHLRIELRPFKAPLDGAQTQLAAWRIADVSTEAARDSERVATLEQALAAVDQMPAGFAAVTAEGALLRVNAAFERAIGYPHGALVARALTLADIAGEEGARQLAQVAADASADSRTLDLDIARGDGRMAALTLIVSPASDGAFTLTTFDREQRASTSRGGDARVASFFQSAPFGIATLDADGRIATCNTAFNRMVFDSRTPRATRALDALCATADADERQALAEALDAAIAGGVGVQPVEITAGEHRQFTRRIYLAPTAAGAGEAAALYVVDSTEQKALEARYAQAQKMEAVGKLAGGIAHDFNNVLTAIIGFSDLLLQTKRPNDPDYKDIRNIQSAANRAAGLVANLLGFSRKQTQQVSVLNLGELAADLTPILRTSVGEKIDLKIQSERDLWYVRADRAQIDNVLINLSVNARDAMGGGGRLTIRTRNVSERESAKLFGATGFAPGEYVLIEVSDTGSGMSQEVMAKIFEPFFTTKGVGKGTGLGLASVYGIVKQSGGFILPESEIGKGTTFRVLLPRYALEADDDVETSLPAKAQSAKRDARASDLTGTGRVLLVEDEVEVRQFAVRALKRQGYQVLEAADGVEALELMSQNDDVDIVVSDVVMPEMDGPSLFKELRKRNPSIKVIFVSGYPNEAFREQLGGEDFAFLPKPFSLPQLAAKVKEELAK